MLHRWLPPTLGLFLIASCGSVPTPLPAPIGSDALEATSLQRADYVTLSAQALAEAIRGRDGATLARFRAFAAGADPDPGATRQIAQQALATSGTAGAPADRAMLREVAGGVAHEPGASGATGILFPRDEGAHLGALTEWWYVNGHLQARSGESFGFEFTMFKVGPLLHWTHVALTDVTGQRFQYSREAIRPSGAIDTVGHLMLRYGDDLLASRADGSYLLAGKTEGGRLDLAMRPEKRPLLINGDGKIDMPEGKDSWYYSQTRVAASGSVDLGTGPMTVSGLTWIDHQWGPFYVSGVRDRWDWFSLQFDDRTEYNLFAFRDRAGKPEARYVNESGADGHGHASREFRMDRLSWWQSPLTQLFYTTNWHLALPATGETVEVGATNPNQELVRPAGALDPLPNYWEGDMRATKTLPDGRKVPGVAYCEHFGFAQPQGPVR